ncbi:hypothetical protein LLG96_19605 [bacterium]|nr:hypothetical protein [bacterium]
MKIPVQSFLGEVREADELMPHRDSSKDKNLEPGLPGLRDYPDFFNRGHPANRENHGSKFLGEVREADELMPHRDSSKDKNPEPGLPGLMDYPDL